MNINARVATFRKGHFHSNHLTCTIFHPDEHHGTAYQAERWCICRSIRAGSRQGTEPRSAASGKGTEPDAQSHEFRGCHEVTSCSAGMDSRKRQTTDTGRAPIKP
ncbi:hypothetical protein [uncultured Paraglaciecola sp.]|uniref:hypothetical protein n=1 Tax=uncultured Paraglaciecola sp. TaxID=1765024 RepID=UPI0026228A0E|nr:hypothetical protein [uncultured Paraglaciecola sp.]